MLEPKQEPARRAKSEAQQPTRSAGPGTRPPQAPSPQPSQQPQPAQVPTSRPASEPRAWDPLGIALDQPRARPQEPAGSVEPAGLPSAQRTAGGGTIAPKQAGGAGPARSSPAVADVTAQLLGASPLNADAAGSRIQNVTPLSTQPQCPVPGARPPQPVGSAALGKVVGGAPAALVAPGTSASVEVELPGINGRSTLSFSVAPKRLEEGLVGTYTAEVTLENALGLGAEVEGENGAVSSGLEAGVRMTYEVTLPENAKDGPPPNPFDPGSIPPGGSVMMKDEIFASSTLGAAFKYLQTEGSTESSVGHAMNIERPADNPNSIRITLGPVGAVSADASIGLGAGPASASIDASHSLEQSAMKVIDFDLSTAQGQEAYQTFMRTGAIAPELTKSQTDKPAVVQEGTRHALDYQSGIGASARIGQLTTGLDLSSTEWSMSTTTMNGKTTNELDWQANNRVILREPAPPNSLSTNDLSLTVLMQDVPPDVAHWIGVSMDGNENYNPENNSDIQLNLNQGRIQDLQDHAQDYVEQIRKEAGTAAGEAVQITPDTALAIELAEAKTPGDVARIFATATPEQLSRGLVTLAQATTTNEDKTVEGLLPDSDGGDADSPVLQTRELS